MRNPVLQSFLVDMFLTIKAAIRLSFIMLLVTLNTFWVLV